MNYSAHPFEGPYPLSVRQAVSEFIAALAKPFTYSPLKNHDAVFGFLWGMPVPFFALFIHAYASSSPLMPGALCEIVQNHPLYVYFLLHPILFATIFGALGTMRFEREQRIRQLVLEVERQCDELSSANERLEVVDRLKTEFLANVTHELKSPLVTALGYTDRIMLGYMGSVTEKQQKGLAVSKRNLDRLRSLIEEILDFSKLESGLAKFNLQPTTLNAAIQAVLENSALKIRDRRTTVTADYPDEPAWVRGDPAKLQQVVLNLLDNAIRFTPEGGRIHIQLERAGPNWRMKIVDTGCGIPAEKMPHLFERFFQADGSRSRVYDGVGLGLVIVRKIVEAHGGTIHVDSTTGPKSGTCVTVELPIAIKPPHASIQTEELNHAAHTAH